MTQSSILELHNQRTHQVLTKLQIFNEGTWSRLTMSKRGLMNDYQHLKNSLGSQTAAAAACPVQI